MFKSTTTRDKTILLFLGIAMAFQLVIGVTALFNFNSFTEANDTQNFSGSESIVEYAFNLNLQNGGFYEDFSEINIKLAFQVNREEIKGIQIKFVHNFTIKTKDQNYNFLGEGQDSKVSLKAASHQSSIVGTINLTNSEALEDIKDNLSVKVSIKAFTNVIWNDLGFVNLIDLVYVGVVLGIFISFKALIDYDKKFTNVGLFMVLPAYILAMILIFSRKIVESGVNLTLFTLYEVIVLIYFSLFSLSVILLILFKIGKIEIVVSDASRDVPPRNTIPLFIQFLDEIQSIKTKPQAFKIVDAKLINELDTLNARYPKYLNSFGIWLKKSKCDPNLKTFYYQPVINQIKAERIRLLEKNPLLKLALYLITISSINPLAFVLKFFSGIL